MRICPQKRFFDQLSYLGTRAADAFLALETTLELEQVCNESVFRAKFSCYHPGCVVVGQSDVWAAIDLFFQFFMHPHRSILRAGVFSEHQSVYRFQKVLGGLHLFMRLRLGDPFAIWDSILYTNPVFAERPTRWGPLLQNGIIGKINPLVGRSGR